MNIWEVGPTHVDFNVTNGCNLACNHCHSSSGDKLSDELSTAECIEAITQLHRLGVMRLSIAGGEPFLRRDILKILEHACGLPGWQVNVITNGMFFARDERVQELRARCPGLNVNVSIEGSGASQFHVLRKQINRPHGDPEPMFRRITDGVRRLSHHGVSTSVNMTLCAPTLNDCLPTYDYAINELGASSLVGIKFFPGGYGKSFRDLYDVPYPQWSEFFTGLTRRKLDGEIPGMQVSVPSAWEFYLPLIEAGIDIHVAERAWGYSSPLREARYRNLYSVGDTCGNAELALAGDGTVYPSVLFVGAEGSECGNIRLQSMRDIWLNSPTLIRIRSIGLHDLNAHCGDCSFSSVCGGGSRARAFAETGSLIGIDAACPLSSPRDLPKIDNAAPEPKRKYSTQPEMHVIGQGNRAIRVFLTEDMCQLRTNGHIIHCGSEESDVLRRMVSAPTLSTRVQDTSGAQSNSGEGALIRPLLLRLSDLGVSEETLALLRVSGS
ncbi:radical SAM protein [Nocardiopsis sp. EMB25]|uniref:radical SAM/SPASM domain-containing protein n=1 Tax=Nocardiopsis sp. EMB25 TaxID=2835867 RepID=UPI0022852094|nr:radical SAM protein [Nocardiopsis sp. EMB25]MCY9787139.1 radical SAM protein [Nocardiopsis sp. EMB25]